MIDRFIWMYWEDAPGARRHAYLDVCFESILRNSGNASIVILDPINVFEWLPELRQDIWEGLPTPVMRADYVRTRLTHRYGGLWLDFDVIAMSSLDELLEPLAREEVVGWGRELEGRFYNNLFAARPGARILEEWVTAQDAILSDTEDWRALPWGALGQDIMWPIARRRDYHVLPMDRIAPVPWFAWRRLISKLESPRRVLATQPITVMLWNSVLGPAIGARSRESIESDRMLLSRLLRIALGKSGLEEESDAWSRLHLLSDLRFSSVGRPIEIRARRGLAALRNLGTGDPGLVPHGA